jgi:hypothetical protein
MQAIRVVTLLVAFAAGCSLVLPFDDLARGASTSPSTEGGAPEGSGIDASSPFCRALVPQPAFCADFDEGPAPWSSQQTSFGTIDQASSDAFVSPPNSLLVDADGTSAGQLTNVFLQHDMPSAMASIYAAFDVRIDKLTSPSQEDGLLVFGLEISGSAGPFYELEINVAPSLVLNEYGENSGSVTRSVKHPFGTLPTNQWMRIALDVALGGTPTATVSTSAPGGNPTVALDHIPIVITESQGVFEFRVGVPFARGPMGATQVRFDNVVFDAH